MDRRHDFLIGPFPPQDGVLADSMACRAPTLDEFISTRIALHDHPRRLFLSLSAAGLAVALLPAVSWAANKGSVPKADAKASGGDVGAQLDKLNGATEHPCWCRALRALRW